MVRIFPPLLTSSKGAKPEIGGGGTPHPLCNLVSNPSMGRGGGYPPSSMKPGFQEGGGEATQSLLTGGVLLWLSFAFIFITFWR
jgi:hypothetical protein